MMNEKENRTAKNIRDSYAEKTVQQNKLEALVALDRKARRPAEIFAYTFGTVGALVLGVGMCLTMKVIGASLSFAFPLGIVVGCVGILAVSLNYPIYRKILSGGMRKHKAQIMRLSDELLNQ